MPEYLVPIVKRELLPLWREYWESGPPSDEAIEQNKDGSLGLSVDVKARNTREAAKIAEDENPGHVAIVESIQKVS